MPVISMFYGLIIRMYYFDNQKHKSPHIHVQYGEQQVVIRIPDGAVLEGELKPQKLKLIHAWVEIHQEDLMANWQLAIEGQKVFTIVPLR
ncbi:MAG: DUF4160 domain-containing protein [Candidatus Hinthialibacter antarcticus]|nr:DUF4160 domain-containing protein [Candidatus Hinthialibacter antarcticus]